MAAGVGNLAALLPEKARAHPERTAVVEYRRGQPCRVTFAELAERVSAAAGDLQGRGIGPEDRVLLFVRMSTALYVELLAVLHVGATAVFLDAWSNRGRLDRAVRLARPRAFIGTPKAHLLRLFSPAVRGIPIHLKPSRRSARREVDPLPVDAAQPALITLTTGSTGEPRAAPRSHALLWAQHRALSRHLALRETDVDMPALPVFVLNNLALGIPSVLPDFDPRRPAHFDPGRIFEQIVREGVTTAGGSPAFFGRLAAWCERRGHRLPLRALFTGGAPLMPRMAREILAVADGECGLVYGSTEAEPISGLPFAEMLESVPSQGEVRGLCVGAPVPEVEVRLIRPWDKPLELAHGGWADWEVPQGEVGEVVVAGEHVLGAYLESPEADRRAKIRDGDRLWHRTGDAAFRDELGRLWLTGRVAQRVERSGRTWWPLPMEITACERLGARHAAYLEVERRGKKQAVLALEGVADRSALRKSEGVDEMAVLPAIPRDPRHASKTDVEMLRRQLSR